MLVEGFGGGAPSEDLSWPRVEDGGDGFELVSTPAGEVGAFRKVLAQHAVGVLVGASLPRAVGVSEVDRDAGLDREGSMGSELFAAVPGERSTELIRHRREAVDECVTHRFGAVAAEGGTVLDRWLVAPAVDAWQVHEHREACRALHDGADGGSLGADDQVAFPVAGNGSVISFGRPLADPHLVSDVTSGALLSTCTRNT